MVYLVNEYSNKRSRYTQNLNMYCIIMTRRFYCGDNPQKINDFRTITNHSFYWKVGIELIDSYGGGLSSTWGWFVIIAPSGVTLKLVWPCNLNWGWYKCFPLVTSAYEGGRSIAADKVGIFEAQLSERDKALLEFGKTTFPLLLYKTFVLLLCRDAIFKRKSSLLIDLENLNFNLSHIKYHSI